MNNNDYDNSFIAEALPAFISEANENIETFEHLLLQLEGEPDNRELLDALFRCAHTIKGAAGIFGLEQVVAFTHHVETLLDQLREGKRVLSTEISTLLLQCIDQMRLLVSAAQGTQAEGEEVVQAREALVQRLHEVCCSGCPVLSSCNSPGSPRPGRTCHWQVSVHFGQDIFRNGMDPLAILNYVRGLGAISNLVCHVCAVPALDAIDPESCYLGFEFSLDTSATREQIESAFSFVRDECTLYLVEPGAHTPDLVSLIEAIPEKPKLGELLVSVGAASATQIQQSLQVQAEVAASAGKAPPLGEILHAKTGLDQQIVAAALRKQNTQRDSDDARFVRVKADRLDAVINLLGELVIASAGASLLARQSRQDTLIEANQQIGRLVEEIRNGTLQLRMVPIGEVFARFRRVVRDTAAELGKNVELEIAGGETELDKTLVERIADPLMHLVRNALDHGLETADERAAAGKPTQGRLTLSACHESGSILIRIEDDGRGINRDKVLARAWERGLLEHGITPPDAQILKLIFEPGFSTAEKVTNLSGRGVGMDVVRRNIEVLRGTVALHSEPGRGTCIEIRLPLTLAIIDGFLVGVGTSKFIFPLDTVVEVIENQPGTAMLDARGCRVVELRGHVLPVVSLRALYALDSPEPERGSVVVIQSGAASFGVLVDQLLGQHQTVIKPLGRMFQSLRGMSGSSILGNGEVALIFDVQSLCQLAEQPTSVLRANSFSQNPVSHQ